MARYNHPSLLLNNHLVSSRDCEQLHKIATPTITVGVVLEVRGKIPLEDESSEPPVTWRLYKSRVCFNLNPDKLLCHLAVTEVVDEVSPFGKLISPAGSPFWQSILPIGIT